MRTEIVNVPGRGICILISDIRISDFDTEKIEKMNIFGGGPFSNIQVIYDEIVVGRKISAIKEVRAQTGWGLREAKQFVDSYYDDPGGRTVGAERFRREYTRQNHLSDDLFKL